MGPLILQRKGGKIDSVISKGMVGPFWDKRERAGRDLTLPLGGGKREKEEVGKR